MPPARPARQRTVTDENDENGGSTRVTRAKAAALTEPEDPNDGKVKKPLGTKKMSTSVSNTNVGQKKRAALGDVSNVTKNETVNLKEVKDARDSKKSLGVKAGLVSKATTQNAGVQKVSRTTSTRSLLGPKDANKKASATDLKRPASGSGVMGGTTKKRQTVSGGSQKSAREETIGSENEPPQKTVIQERVTEVKKEIVVEVPKPAEINVTKRIINRMDAEDYNDPLMVAEYVTEIFDYLKDLEENSMPNPNYMDHQDHLEWHLRGVLVDWLMEVHLRFHLLPETLFLAVNIIDRFLSTRIVELEKLQLVGITAMFIASKYEEVLSPHVQNFKHVADDGFSEEEILKAERFVLSALKYDLSYPNPINFLRRVSKADHYDIQTRTLAKYLMEISLVDHRFMRYAPSLVTAASMYLARLILQRTKWDATLVHYSGYTEEEIEPVFKLMVDYLYGPVPHEAFFKKYASKKFLKASILTRQWAKRHAAQYLESSPCSSPLGSRGLQGR